MRWSTVLIGSWLALVVSNASSHDLRPIFIDISQASATGTMLRWKVPSTVARSQLPEIALSGECQFEAEPRVVLRADTYQGEQSFQCATGLTGESVTLNFPASNPSLTTIIRVHTYDDQLLSGLLPPDERTWVIPETPGRWEVALNYTELGIEHIALGWDHLLFVALMVLLAGNARRTLIMVTGFTLAHSLTLALSTLELVSLPIPVVETAIALSIVFLATEIARGDEQTLAHRYPVLVTSLFGLLHGFGFASVLREVGLPSAELPTALLFFNIGVEIGQIVFVVAICAAGLGWQAMIRRSSARKSVLTGARTATAAAYAVGTVASFWTFERLLAI